MKFKSYTFKVSINRETVIKSITYLLHHFPCVAIIGARQVGKTSLLKVLRPDSPFFDLEKQSDFGRISRDPEFFLSQFRSQTVVMDEAQQMPTLFAALRVAIDSDRHRNGQFLISGSSSPSLVKNIHETLAGRVAIFQLSGLLLEEFYGRIPSPLYSIIESTRVKDFRSLFLRYTQSELLEACVVGSYPEPVTKRADLKFHSLWMENYFQTYIKRDVRDLFPGIDIQNYQRLIHILAYSSGQILNASNFARSLDVSQPTIKSYLKTAEGTFLWRSIESFSKNVTKRVSKMPKGYLRDSGLLNFLLRNNDVTQFLNHPDSGSIWEAFVTEQILSGFAHRLMRIEPFYYRTHNQAEIDLVLEGDFGLLPIEIKLGTSTHPKKLNSLKAFIEERNLQYGMIINNAETIEWLTPKIVQIPAGFL